MSQAGLCDAVRRHVLVQFRYGADGRDRVFAPHVVYRSASGNLLVGGVQFHPAGPTGDGEIRTFKLGSLRNVRVTADRFRPDRRFERAAERLGEEPICRITGD